jgi:hypothetical protein
MPGNFKMNPVLKRAKSAQLGITKTKLGYRTVLGAFLDNSKTKQANNNAKNALRVNIA